MNIKGRIEAFDVIGIFWVNLSFYKLGIRTLHKSEYLITSEYFPGIIYQKDKAKCFEYAMSIENIFFVAQQKQPLFYLYSSINSVHCQWKHFP